MSAGRTTARPTVRLVHNAPPPSRTPTSHQTAAERQWLAVHGAWQDGHAQGEREGYIAGWRWGAVCGACAGLAGVLLATAACLVLGITVNVPTGLTSWWPL